MGTHTSIDGYYLLCQVCRFKVHSRDIRVRWDGLLVCSEDWEIRHPQLDLVAPRPQISPTRVSPDTEGRNFDDVYPNGLTMSDF